MPEAYTCLCGNQSFEIYDKYVICSECKERFTLPQEFEMAWEFNERIRS